MGLGEDGEFMTVAMRIPLRYLVLHTDRPVTETGTQLRGYIADRFPQYTLLHQHLDRPVLAYPKVQYKVLAGTPSILGIADGASVLKEITDDITELEFHASTYKVLQKVTYDQLIPIIPSKDMVEYRFVSPWLALNQENYQNWRGIYDWKERKQFLNAILVGNMLSMAKGLGVVIEHRLNIQSHLEKTPVYYKGVGMTGFTGSIRANIQLPDYIGIGKGVSQGFGTLRHAIPVKSQYATI